MRIWRRCHWSTWQYGGGDPQTGRGHCPRRPADRRQACYILWPQVGDRFWSDACRKEVLADFVERPDLDIRGVFTHIAEGHVLPDAEVAARIDHFVGEMQDLCPNLPVSVADSHLASRNLSPSLGFGRVGLFPLGALGAAAVDAHSLRPALRLTARVIGGCALPRTARVGYGQQQIAAGQAVSVLDIGFATGLPFEFFRHCPAVAPDGRRLPFLKTPWMEYSALCTDGPPLAVGSEVELFGDAESLAAQAARADLPVEALFCHLRHVTRDIAL